MPIPIDSLDFQAHNLDLFIYYRGHRQPSLYRGAGAEFTRDDLDSLTAQGVEFLHIPALQHAEYRLALAGRLDRMFSDPEACRRERARIVRAACTRMIDEVLLLPDQPEPIAAISALARQFGAWCESDPGTFSYMLEMADHDLCTTTHMVNVGVGCGLLGARLRPGDGAFATTLYQGGLLHDIGKRDVPQAVLNKEGDLSPAEWDLLRRHPELGYDELARNAQLPGAVLEMARDHHERPDGGGYPRGRTGPELSLPTRICTVVDVFDALTAARPYRAAMPPRDALRIMEREVGPHFDESVFAAWRELVEELLRADPSRTQPMPPAERAGTPPGDRAQARRGSPERGPDAPADPPPAAAPASRRERRGFGRYTFALPIQAEFVRQLKSYPVGLAERFTVRAIDISRSGMQIETPWPLAINDLLVVHLRTRRGQASWRARVVRVRACRRRWRAGLQLLCSTGAAAPAA
ncbi:MAG TPA: HD domain-containing phosphohydrolase [Phycisphaerales bacterium]|nr:HD domain-containing phosphohydrolase [Phycisphaerales bacterium]